MNKADFEELEKVYSDIHAEFAHGQDKLAVNPRLRIFIRNLRKLLWPGKSYKAYNAGTKGVYRPMYHQIRESMAQGEFQSVESSHF